MSQTECYRACSVCLSSALRFPASVSHVLSQPSSACVLFLVCCANTLPPLCCKHAELWETYKLSGIIYLLNTNLLLQPTQDSNLGLLQILQLLVVRIKHRFGKHISIYQHQHHMSISDSACSKSNMNRRLQHRQYCSLPCVIVLLSQLTLLGNPPIPTPR